MIDTENEQKYHQIIQKWDEKVYSNENHQFHRMESNAFLVWPCGLGQNKKHYQYYKSFLALLFPVLFIYGIILQNHQSIKYDDDFHYEDYVSNWNELQCCIWAFIHCYLVLVQSKSIFYRVIRQVGIGMNFSCLTTSIAITLTYWCLLPADRHEYNLNALHQHGLLFVITAVDFILSTARIRWFYIVFGWIFAGSYGFYVYILYLVYGSERDAVYHFLDFSKDYDLAVKYVLGMTFGAQSVLFAFLFILEKLKFWIWQRKNGSIQYEKYSRESNVGSNSGFESVTKEFVNTEYEHSFASLPQSDK